MNKDSVINQLVYYLNYGFISKDLQEDIQEGLMKKKDIEALERLLDSVEYELGKKSNGIYEAKNSLFTDNNPNINYKSKIMNNNTSSNTMTYAEKLSNPIEQSNQSKLDNVVFKEKKSTQISEKKNSLEII